MQQQAAICEICGDAIYVEVERARPASSIAFSGALERAATAHLATHPTPVVERFLLRKHLDEIEPDVRPAAVKQIYDELRKMWGDADGVGLYSIDEVLGSPSVYRLWWAANRCTWPTCRHAP